MVEVAVIDTPDLPQAGHRVTNLGYPVQMRSRLDNDPDGLGVRENPVDLVGGGGLVDRDGHCSHRPEGEVRQGPLIPRATQDADRIPGRDSSGDEAARQLVDPDGKVGRRDIPPTCSGAHTEGHSLRLALGVASGEIGQAAGTISRDDCRGRGLAHEELLGEGGEDPGNPTVCSRLRAATWITRYPSSHVRQHFVRHRDCRAPRKRP